MRRLALLGLLWATPALAQSGAMTALRPGSAMSVMGQGRGAMSGAAAVGGAPAAGIALVASTQIAGAPSGGTSSAIATIGATLLLAACGSAGTPTASDTLGNTWVRIGGQGATANSWIFYVANPAVGASDAITVAGTYSACSVMAFSGVATSSPLDAQNEATASNTTAIQPGSVTPSLANSLIVTGLAGVASDPGPTMTLPAGWTITYQLGQNNSANYQFGAGFLIQSGDAAVNPTWTLAAQVGSLASAIAVFKP